MKLLHPNLMAGDKPSRIANAFTIIASSERLHVRDMNFENLG
jgi:hypothetical protein